MYNQRRAAGERVRGTPTPAFIGTAGDYSKKLTKPAAPLNKPVPLKKPERILIADTLVDRVAFQRMRNEDLFQWGGSHIDDQGITFSVDGKITDAMKQLYQSSLKATCYDLSLVSHLSSFPPLFRTLS